MPAPAKRVRGLKDPMTDQPCAARVVPSGSRTLVARTGPQSLSVAAAKRELCSEKAWAFW